DSYGLCLDCTASPRPARHIGWMPGGGTPVHLGFDLIALNDQGKPPDVEPMNKRSDRSSSPADHPARRDGPRTGAKSAPSPTRPAPRPGAKSASIVVFKAHS